MGDYLHITIPRPRRSTWNLVTDAMLAVLYLLLGVVNNFIPFYILAMGFSFLVGLHFTDWYYLRRDRKNSGS